MVDAAHVACGVAGVHADVVVDLVIFPILVADDRVGQPSRRPGDRGCRHGLSDAFAAAVGPIDEFEDAVDVGGVPGQEAVRFRIGITLEGFAVRERKRRRCGTFWNEPFCWPRVVERE